MTSRTILCRSAAIAAALCVSATAARAQQIIFPPTGTGGSYVIAVVSDGYSANEEWMFNRAVSGLVLNGLFADKFFKANGGVFTVKKFFHPVTKSGESAFGIKPNYNIHQCYIDWDQANTTTLIDTVVKPAAPERTIVIGNYEGVSIGCTVGTWTYVSAGAREIVGVLEHEFGHLIADLFDEYSLPPDQAYKGAAVDEKNCSNAPFIPPPVGGRGGPPPPPAKPWWKKVSLPSTPTDPEGCNYAAKKIVRPFEHCRMHAAHGDFCDVCVKELKYALGIPDEKLSRADPPRAMPVLMAGFAFGQPARPAQPPAQPGQPPPPAGGRSNLPDRQPSPPGTPVPTVRVVLELTPVPGGVTTKVLTIADVTTPEVQRYRRTGDLVFAVVENNDVKNPLQSGVITGDPFQQRVYGGSGAPHQPSTTAAKASVVVMIPNVNRQQLQGRDISIKFYKLKPSSARDSEGNRQDIDRQRLGDLITTNQATPFAELTATDLKKAVQQLP